MIIIVDESGCLGFNAVSSEFFLIGLVIFKTAADAQHASACVENAKKFLGYKREFRFNKCNDAQKEAFYTAISPCRFSIYCIIIEKASIRSAALRKSPRKFYNFFLKQILNSATKNEKDFVVKIDKNGNKEMRDECAAYLRHQCDSHIRKLKFVDSKKDNLIQLADMCVSAIARKYNGAERAKPLHWYQLLSGKIKNEWEFGK